MKYRAYPSPAFWTLVLLLGSGLALVFVKGLRSRKPIVTDTKLEPDHDAYSKQGASSEPSIAEEGVSDRHLSWHDPDLLGFKAIARGLSRLLRNENTEPPLTIAVTGP